MKDSTLYRRLRTDGTVEIAVRVPPGDNHSRAWTAISTGVMPEHVAWGSTGESLV